MDLAQLKSHFPFPEIRPSQEKALEKFVVDEEKGKKFSIFELPTGIGKCFAKGTPILMFDGVIKPVEEIKEGELVMGPDSTPRKVISLSQGRDELFRVTPVKGDSFVVNSSHILSVKMTENHKQIINLTLSDYLARSNNFKHHAKLYRTGVDFESVLTHDLKELAYYIGLWLGDGSSKRLTEVTTADKEIQTYLSNLASNFGLSLTAYNNGSKATSWNITTQAMGGRKDRNILLNELKKLDISSNKSIPLSFKTASRISRLKLLAGYLDADGSLASNTFEFSSVNKNLADDISFIARSLGFSVYVKPCHKTCQTGNGGVYYRGNISGDIHLIPTLLPRKQAKMRQQKKSVLVTGFKVEPVGLGDYYGFGVDGDHLFLLGDFTVVHNSGLSIAALGWAADCPVEPPLKPGGTILTSQKILQDQYASEFGSIGLADLRGASNYRCGEQESNCEIGSVMNKLAGTICEHCPYRSAKAAFMASPRGITNFAYYLTDSMFKRQLPKRKLIIIDEAHNTENVLIAFSEIGISANRLEEFDIKLPTKPLTTIPETKYWVEHTVIQAADIYGIKLKEEIAAALQGHGSLMALLKKEMNLSSFKSNLGKFLESESEMWFIHQTDGLGIKPLRGDVFSEELLFSRAEKIMFMSATILDPRTFVRNLGISVKDCGYMSLPSEFAQDNRKIIFTPAGSMSYKNYDTTLPKLLNKIERILEKHKNEKGIIHCQSFKLMNHIQQGLRRSPHYSRLVAHDSQSRAYAVDRHLTSTEPTVLLSPSMTEGLDLRGDLSRFQVVAKMPFNNLADPYVKRRMELDKAWYSWTTALTLIQGLGRSIRSKEDYARSYIIDQDFNMFLKTCNDILPEWWLESIEFR